jgi:SHS2 domain-containing protein
MLSHPIHHPAPGGFEVIDHTADWALRVYGRDLSHLFRAAATGMVSLIVADPSAVPLTAERHLQFTAPDPETLLVDWLGELAYLAESELLVFPDFDIHELTPAQLSVTMRGGPPAEFQKHIKAVTYHSLQITPTERGLEATIVFDV